MSIAFASSGWPCKRPCSTSSPSKMRGLDGDGAEVQYAFAYALEQLGERDEARKAYEIVLMIDSGHEKARARLRVLAGQASDT